MVYNFPEHVVTSHKPTEITLWLNISKIHQDNIIESVALCIV